MMDAIIIFFELIFFAWGFFYLFKKDYVYGLLFFMLVLYGLPALIGYRYLSYLSVRLKAYYGQKYWMGFNIFILLSCISFFIFSNLFIKLLRQGKRYTISVVKTNRKGNLAYCVLWGATIIQAINLVYNYDLIGYQRGSSNILMTVAALLCHISVGYNLIIYILIREKRQPQKTRMYLYIFFVCSMLIFIFFSIKVGARQDIAAFIIGVFFVEIKLGYFNIKSFIIYVGIAALAAYGLKFIVEIRSGGRAVSNNFLESMINSNYYPPAHILFTAMRYDFVRPLRVLQSNICNALILMNNPYLQADIMDIILPGVATRSKSYAFYIFSEGYMFMGKAGFLYNGFIVAFGLYFWRRIFCTDDDHFNFITQAIMACFTITLVRGQSSYFIKNIYTNIIFNVVIYLMLTGKRIKLTQSALGRSADNG